MDKLNLKQRSLISIGVACLTIWALTLANNFYLYSTLVKTAKEAASNTESVGAMWLNVAIMTLIIIVAFCAMYWRISHRVIVPTSRFASQVSMLNIDSNHFKNTFVENSPELQSVSLKLNQSFAELFRQRRFINLLMSSIEEAIITLSTNGNINYANNFAKSLLTQDGKLHENKISFLVTLTNYNLQPLDSYIEDVICQRKSVSFREELRFNSNKSHVTLANCSIYPLLSHSGDKCEGAIVLIKPDITPVA